MKKPRQDYGETGKRNLFPGGYTGMRVFNEKWFQSPAFEYLDVTLRVLATGDSLDLMVNIFKQIIARII